MEIDLEGMVVSAASLRAPLSGLRACAAHIEALRGGAVVGALILGDLLRLSTADGEIELVVRRAAFLFSTRFDEALPLRDPVPAELVPLLRLRPEAFRERRIASGDRFRIRGTFVRQRSDASAAFLVADDRSTIRLDEALSRTS